MEPEDIAKKLEWFEKEHRKDRATITDLQEKVGASEEQIILLRTQLTDLTADLSRFKSTGARLDQFDSMVTQYRNEIAKSIEEVEKRRVKQERDLEDRRRKEIDVVNKTLIEIRNQLDGIQDLKRGLQMRVEEDLRLAREFGDLGKNLVSLSQVDEELRHSIRSVEEARRYDIKRVTDIQGEIASARKRTEDAREKIDLNSDIVRQLDNRINELLASEVDRRQTQLAFIEQQSLSNVERERGWKEMQARFEGFSKQNSNIDQQLIALEDTHRSVKRSQETFDEMNTRIERRINEITEIQRLTEERFRQEWVTLKSDDQKRWANFTVSQDDWIKELHVELEKLQQKIATLDDASQTLQDLFDQTTETTENQLQELMNWTHEFLTNFERVTGRVRVNK